MRKILGLSCLLVLAMPAPALSCFAQRAPMINNMTSTAVMTVRSGKSCGYRFGGSLGPTQGVKIVQQPSHGTVRISSRSGVYYRSRPGYVGTDTFGYARYGLDGRGSASTRTAIITVTVTP